MKSIFKKIIYIILILLNVGLSIIFVYYLSIKNDLNSLDLSRLKQNSTSVIYDDLGQEINYSKAFIKDNITFNDLNENLINAIISIEDKDFYYHNGINYKRLVKALLNNLKAQKFQEGASTITQQLIKNIYLSNDKTIVRKLKEFLYAKALENEVSKEDILTSYLNNILFGGNLYGIKAASLFYFSKDVLNLNINESAFLAGMIQAPNKYNPYKNISLCDERKNIVLREMYQNNYITENEYMANKNLSITNSLTKISDNNKTYLASALSYINHKLAYLGYNIHQDSIQIKTSFNDEITKSIYHILENTSSFKDNPEMLYGICLIDNKTAKIKALLGNKDYIPGNIDYSFMVKRQPGSTIKPILDYAPAIEYLNYGPLTFVNDEKITYQSGEKVKNYDSIYKGTMTLRYALKDSRNTVAIKLFNEVGYKKAFEFSTKMGIFPEKTIYEANAIGGFSNGYTVLEIANAYMSFANMGIYQKASGIDSLDFEKMQIKEPSKKVIAMKKETAFIINDILHDVLKNSIYEPKNIYLSSKTGQTNFSYEQLQKYNLQQNYVKDSWIVGYTRNYTLAIWIGFDDISETNYLSGRNIHLGKKLFKQIFNTLNDSYVYYPVPNNLCYAHLDYVDNRFYLQGKITYGKPYQDYIYKNELPHEYYNALIDEVKN